MTEPLTAGDPLSPKRPNRDRKPSPSGKPGKKRAPFFVRLANGLIAAILGIVVLGGGAAAAAGWLLFKHYSADLPDVDGLRNYKPPVMSQRAAHFCSDRRDPGCGQKGIYFGRGP
jgi:penicillin-binding protein 1A